MAADRVLETDTIGTSGLYIAPVPGPPLTTRRRRGGRGREAHTIRIQEAATTPKSHFWLIGMEGVQNYGNLIF